MDEQKTQPIKTNLIPLILLAAVLLVLGGYFIFTKYQNVVNPPEVPGSVINGETEAEDTPITEERTDPQSNEVKVYFIDIDNKRGLNNLIGCGDSMIALTQQMDMRNMNTQSLISEAIKLLVAEKDQFVGKGGAYNSLYQSNLTLEKVEIIGERANIYLTGQLLLGGVCDNPRFENQIGYTAKQFTGIETINIFINNQPYTGSGK